MKTQYAPHIFSLCALSVLGNAVFLMPFYKSGGFLSVLISAILSLGLISMMTRLIKWGQNNKIIFFIVFMFIGATAIYGTVTTFLDYVGFLKSAQMPRASIYLLSSFLLGLIFIFVLSNTSAIYKYSLLVAVISAAMVIICFAGGIKSFDFSSFKKDFLKLSFNIKDFLQVFSSLAVIPFFVSLSSKNIPKKPLVLGALAGFLLLLLCLTQSVFTLGFADNISYPYLKAVGVISSGSLFTRLDGFVYFIFFITSLTKITVCVKTVCLTVSRLPFDKLP